jgi:hypothetical protein
VSTRLDARGLTKPFCSDLVLFVDLNQVCMCAGLGITKCNKLGGQLKISVFANCGGIFGLRLETRLLRNTGPW